MNFPNEFALLFAVATPVVVLFAMNLFLMLEGERGTLMFPRFASPKGTADSAKGAERPANDEFFRHVA